MGWILAGCGCLAILALLALLVGGGIWLVKENPQWFEQFGSTETPSSPASPSTEAPGGTPATAPSGTPARSGVTRVELSWSERVDMDLEIWNASGQNLLERSFNLCGEDVKDGTAGREWFEFRRFDASDDYSSGVYVVSLYFAARPDNSSVDQARATITVTKPDGTTLTRQKTINWDPGRDQWHAFSIDAATGAVTDKDEFVRIQQNNN